MSALGKAGQHDRGHQRPQLAEDGQRDDVGHAVDAAVVLEDGGDLEDEDGADREQHQRDDRDAADAYADHLGEQVLRHPIRRSRLENRARRVATAVSSSR